MPAISPASSSTLRFAALQRRMAALDHSASPGTKAKAGALGIPALPLGLVAIDTHLPQGGLARGRLHEVIEADGGAATGFGAALLARFSESAGMALWCVNRRVSESAMPYGPGLAAFGLAPQKLILVRVRCDRDALFAMEEALRHSAFTAALAEVHTLDLTASRRLQLAAESGGVTGLVLRPRTDNPGATAAATRWRVTARPMPARPASALPPPCWQIELLRCRGGAAGGPWTVEWHHETRRFALATESADGSDHARAAGLAV